MIGSPSFEELTIRLRAFAEARDWGRFHTPKDLAMSVSIEAAELLEVFQWKDSEEIDELVRSETDRAALADEVADVLIYLLRLADVVGIDPAAAAAAKIERNEERFPQG